MTSPGAALIALVLVTGLSACAGGGDTSPERERVVGVVTSVQGDLSGIEKFEVLLSDGTTLDVIPAPGLLFEGGPLTHVRDHLRTGEPIWLSIDRGSGSAVAYEVGDSG